MYTSGFAACFLVVLTLIAWNVIQEQNVTLQDASWRIGSLESLVFDILQKTERLSIQPSKTFNEEDLKRHDNNFQGNNSFYLQDCIDNWTYIQFAVHLLTLSTSVLAIMTSCRLARFVKRDVSRIIDVHEQDCHQMIELVKKLEIVRSPTSSINHLYNLTSEDEPEYRGRSPSPSPNSFTVV
jgi:hypothetical protein